MIKKVVKKLSKIKKIFLLFLIIPFCVIIGLLIKSYADDNLNTRPVSYDIGSTVHYVFSFFTDSIKFHIRANGYENVLSQETDDNFASIIDSGSSKMQGYGNYVMKADTSLFSFIEWCHNKNATYTEACAIVPGENELKSCDYSKLMNYKGQVISGTSKEFVNKFWQNMTNQLGDTFKQYQDSYFFEKYTYKATQQIGINLAKLRSYVNNDEYSVKEYFTCLTSYMFSYEKEAAPDTMEIKKGDVVPFLYYKRNVDEDDPQEIAKYAYVPLIEGWVTGINGTHLWENEYQYLYGSYDPNDLDWDLETLEAWYSECYDKYKGSKGRKGNNLLGSDIETIIQSDYIVSQQLEATEHYLNQVFTELGIETNFKETMAKNELMAKYMMENSSFSETIKDYNDTIDFMTENIQRGTSEEKNTHTAVLSDFQVIELNQTLNVDGQSDEDTISDKQELGPIKWVDITEFVRKAYDDAVRSGQSHRATFEEQVDDIIYANGGFYNDITGNYIDGSVKWADNRKLKVLYRTYDYRSNPLLNDTDFDGIDDNTDSKPIDNRFTGTSADIGKVEYNNDFRWFFTKKEKYNDELAVMSLIASNLANGNTVSTNQASGNIIQYMQTLGFSDIRNIGDTIGDVYIGKKTIDYYGNKKDVIAVFIGNCDTALNYKAVLKFKEDEIGNIRTNTLLHYMNNTVDDLAKQIVDKINIASSNEKCYWVSGYGLAGSIATEVSDRLIRSDSGSNEVYCYTFGATNTIDNYNDSNAEIKNIINQDDLSVRFITGGKAGEDYGLSIAEDLTNEYRDITGSNNYKGNYLYTNYIVDIYNRMDTLNIPANVVTNMKTSLSTYLVNYNKITNREVIDNYNDLVIVANEWAEGNRQAHSIKSYYVLAKSLNGFDLLDGDSEKQEKYNKILVVAFNSSEEIDNDDIPKDKRDGYYFNRYSDVDIEYNNSNEKTVRIKDFMYSNYTIDTKSYKDINYVKFWNTTDRDVESLYKYNAGDMSQYTKCTYGNYKNKKWIDLYKGDVEEDNQLNLGNNNKLVTINDRILAAFPPALFSEYSEEFNKATDNMNMVANYNEPNDAGTDGGTYKGASITGKSKDMYKLIDVVIEDENRQQFVVPFIAIDAKNIHLLPNYSYGSKKGMFSNFTDNRYGQVMEQIIDTNPITYNYYKFKITSNELNAEVWFDENLRNKALEDIANGNNTYTYLNKMITYYDKDDERKATYISAIEPYIKIGGSENNLNAILTNVMCGKGATTENTKCKIVSMRLYDEKCADINGNVNKSGKWYKNYKKIEYKTNFYDKYKDELNNKIPYYIVRYN